MGTEGFLIWIGGMLLLPLAVEGGILDGLVAHYTFDGNAQDSSGNGNHGVINGGPTLTTDRVGVAASAYYFSGIASDYISASPLSFPGFGNGARSLCAWHQAELNDRIVMSIGANGGGAANTDFAISLKTSTIMLYGMVGPNDRQFSGAPNLVDSLWHHTCVTKAASGGANLYVDGAFVSQAPPHTYATANEKIRIGAWANHDRPFKGKIDDVRYYNRELSASEVTEVKSAVQNYDLLHDTYTKRHARCRHHPEDNIVDHGCAVCKMWNTCTV